MAMMTPGSADLTEEDAVEEGALEVLRRGLAASPELRAGVRSSIGLRPRRRGRASSSCRSSIRQIIDNGLRAAGSDPAFVYGTYGDRRGRGRSAVTWLNRITYLRLVKSAQETLYGLRVRTFDHIHKLSMAHHTESKRGVLVSRVTSDIVTLAQFAQWGAISWVVNSMIVFVTLGVMAIYSWQLALVTTACFIPVIPAMRFLQRRQLAGLRLATDRGRRTPSRRSPNR